MHYKILIWITNVDIVLPFFPQTTSNVTSKPLITGKKPCIILYVNILHSTVFHYIFPHLNLFHELKILLYIAIFKIAGEYFPNEIMHLNEISELFFRLNSDMFNGKWKTNIPKGWIHESKMRIFSHGHNKRWSMNNKTSLGTVDVLVFNGSGGLCILYK